MLHSAGFLSALLALQLQFSPAPTARPASSSLAYSITRPRHFSSAPGAIAYQFSPLPEAANSYSLASSPNFISLQPDTSTYASQRPQPTVNQAPQHASTGFSYLFTHLTTGLTQAWRSIRALFR